MKRISTAVAVLGVCHGLIVLPVQAQQTDADDSARQEFAAGLEAARSGTSPAEPDSDRLRTYRLYPYLQAARLEWRLLRVVGSTDSIDSEIEQFLSLYEDEPVARGLRRAWLTSLDRRSLPSEFREQYRRASANPELECRYLQLQIDAGELPIEQIRSRWLTGSQLPIECEPLFQWARGEELIDNDLVEQRVRLLLTNGQAEFARVIASRLPPGRATPLLQWAELILNPARSIDSIIAEHSRGLLDEALLDGWSRLARNQPGRALARIDELIAAVEPDRDLESELTRALAYGLAWDRRPESLALFDRIATEHRDDYAREWQARAAMWAGDWPLVAETISGMSTDLAGTSAWRYWLARATDETENSRAAEPIYRSLLKDDNFYSAMASARLGERVTPGLIQHAPNAATIEAIAELPPFRRAHELLLAGLPTEARREWNYGYTMLAAAPSEQAMHLASSWGRHDWSVETATAHGVFFDYPLLYPQVHMALASRAADDADIAAELVLAVMRQESLFDPSAVSLADAIGLMQLQPATATRAAQRIGQSIPGRDELLDPAVNIRLGAAQIRALLDEFDDQLGPALAGYNAGYNAAVRWLPDAPIALDVWIENIPYNETRAYVRRVLWHSLVYRWLESDRAQSSRDWLTDVRRP